jgi:adenosylcobyric acid synthase
MKGIMIQGTGSDAGKSFIVTALCRIFSDMGFTTCPFKSQNMSNNSYVTFDGFEIGRAQGVQAEAARQEPNGHMNPILLKPKKDTQSEIVLMGKVFDVQEGKDYYKNFTLNQGIKAIRASLEHIKKEFELIVIEGAGSPVEMNLNDREIVNMRIANEADVPVILVTDIDRGGSFGSIVGTLELLGEDRKRVKGIIFNKFRGDMSLFDDGVKFIEEYTGVKVVGVMPYLHDISIENEDNLSTDYYFNSNSKDKIVIGVVDTPFVSNNTDIEIFRYDEDVEIRKLDRFTDMKSLDAIIIPGTKSTIQDMKYLYDTGLSQKIQDFYKKDGFVFGICGGYQMLGKNIIDEVMVDSTSIKEIDGMALLPLKTHFKKEKKVERVVGMSIHPLLNNIVVDGYEIHLGVSEADYNEEFLPLIRTKGNEDGLADKKMRVAGTYLHNIFHNDQFRNSCLNIIRKSKGYDEKPIVNTGKLKEKGYDDLAKAARENLNMDYILKIINEN